MMQPPLFMTVESNWRPPKMEELPSWAGAKRIGFDLETRDEHLKKLGPGGGRRKDSYTVGFSFAIDDGPGFYLPIRHLGGDNMDCDKVLEYLRDQARGFTGEIVGANLQYDIDFASSDGIVFPNIKYFRDIQVAEPLIDELKFSYSLENVAKSYGFRGKNEEMLNAAAADYRLDPKKDMWELPARYVGIYGEDDARLPLEILKKQERIIDKQDLWEVYNLESKLLPILAKMRRRGVRIDLNHLAFVESWALQKEKEMVYQIKKLTGHNIGVDNVWKVEALLPALQSQGLSYSTTPKTGKPQINDDFFRNHKGNAVAESILRARKVNKLRTTFAKSIRNHLIDGRIHCTFNQLRRPKDGGDEGESKGARYGRLSSNNPNLQQQPSRDDFASMWRAIYLPEDNSLWAANDYSQQEPRMGIHYACISKSRIGTRAWNSAIDARDKYRNDPSTDNHQMIADIIQGRQATPKERKYAKDIFLGYCYGMGPPKLCHTLGLPTIAVVSDKRGRFHALGTHEADLLRARGAEPFEAAGPEGLSLFKQFDAAVPFVKRIAKAVEKAAKERGYIITIGGRRCRFPVKDNGQFDWTHKAFNRLIQGSSGDQTKTAMVMAEEAGFDMIIQVHDEIAFNVQNEKEAHEAAQLMEECVPLQVPSKVDVEIGKSWGHSMGYKDLT